jgi:hypothetical protein
LEFASRSGYDHDVSSTENGAAGWVGCDAQQCIGAAEVPGDAAVRRVLRTELERQYATEPSTVIVDELGLCRGQNRVDVVVVNGILHGYEIKSDRDTLRRLSGQVEMYGRVLDRATLVVGEKHVDEARSVLPPWWGITLAVHSRGETVLKPVRKGRQNRARDPRSLVELLWLDEAKAILEERGLAVGVRGKPRSIVWNRVCEQLSLDEIAAQVRHHLKRRKSSLISSTTHAM